MPTEILRPNAVGTYSQLGVYPTGVVAGEHWDKVDEVVADDASTYVLMTPGVDEGVYKRDLYALPAHEGSGAINSVKVYVRAKINVSYSLASIRTHDTVYDSANLGHGGTWSTKSNTWTTNPNTGNPWTWAEIDALEAGVSLRGVSSSYYAQCTQVYVEVATDNGTETLRPNGEGSETSIHSQWTSEHWRSVDEETADEDDSYVEKTGATGTGLDSYNLPILSGEVIITNVRVYGRFRKASQAVNDDYSTTVGLGIRTNGADHYTNFLRYTATYSVSSDTYATNPETGLAWTLEDINNLQIYIRSTLVNLSLEHGGLTRGRCTQVYAVITYTVAPTVTTDPASSVEATTATLHGTLDNDGGLTCECGFEYGLDTDYGTETLTESKETGETFSQALTGLLPNTTYHFRAIATNVAGTSYGADQTFTTEVAMSSVTTDPATGVGMVLANLNGTLDDDGGQACDCGFEWGETVAYGNTTSTQSKETSESFSQGITGLTPRTTYHFRAIATNDAGMSYGADETFTTYSISEGGGSRGYALSRHEL